MAASGGRLGGKSMTSTCAVFFTKYHVMKINLKKNDVLFIVEGMKMLDAYMKEGKVPYKDRMPFINAKMNIEYQYKRELRKEEKMRRLRKKEKVT